MTLKNNFLVLSLVFGLACSTSKSVQKAVVQPDWVNQKPVSSDYYIGVGTSSKSNLNYLTEAKNKALADLATEISTQVSSSSALFTFESTLGFTDEYTSYVKSVSNEQLEGFEMVTAFESPDQYWVYYRLNKQLYAEIKHRRLEQATQIGIDYLRKALKFKVDSDYYNAIASYLKGIEAIKPYLNESLEVSMDEKSVFLGTELFSGIINTISSINVVSETPEIRLKSTSFSVDVNLIYSFKSNLQSALKGLPVSYRIGDKILTTAVSETSIEGKTNYKLTSIPYKSGRFDIICELDMERIARECTRDPFVRKMLRKFEAPKAKTLVILDNPTFYLTSNEKNMGEPVNPKIIEAKVMQILVDNGFPVVFNQPKADFTLSLDIETEKSKSEGRFNYSTIMATIRIFDAQQQLVYTRQFDKIEGVQLNYRDAGMDAYQKLSDYLDRNFLVKLNEALKR